MPELPGDPQLTDIIQVTAGTVQPPQNHSARLFSTLTLYTLRPVVASSPKIQAAPE
jgi:hypothetical protein